MNILQITPRMPYPLTDGGAIAVFNITKWHALQGHTMTMVTYPLDSKEETEEAIAAISPYSKVFLVSKPLAPRWRVLARTMFHGAYPLERRNIPEMYDLLEKVVQANDFDLVHVDHAHMGPFGLWLRDRFGLPIILRENNFESQIYERFAETERNPVKSRLARIHGKRLKKEEIRFIADFDAVAAISEEDARLMRQWAPNANLRIIPAGADTDFFRPTVEPADPDTILSVGTLAWDPNFDSLRYFLAEIFPLILKSRPQARLEVVGASAERILPFSKPFGSSVVLRGRVPDVRDYLARAAVVVVPLRIGGGMRVKLLEFFAAGKAIVSTTIGAEGNRAESGVHLLIRDGRDEFSEGVLELLGNPELRKSIGTNARELAVTSYSWQSITRRFTELYEEVLAGHAALRDA